MNLKVRGCVLLRPAVPRDTAQRWNARTVQDVGDGATGVAPALSADRVVGR